jgi:hypothetical protein
VNSLLPTQQVLKKTTAPEMGHKGKGEIDERSCFFSVDGRGGYVSVLEQRLG